MTDCEVENIVEINEIGINARIVTLPWEYTKIVGKKNGRYQLAFNLRYFDDFTGESLERKLRKYPTEISEGYYKKRKGLVNGDWMLLNNDRTMCKKIKCTDSEPWGRSLIIATLEDVLYIHTQKNILADIQEANSLFSALKKSLIKLPGRKLLYGKVVLKVLIKESGLTFKKPFMTDILYCSNRKIPSTQMP